MHAKYFIARSAALFFILLTGLAPMYGQSQDICSAPLYIQSPSVSAYFTLGPSCHSSDMMVTITLVVPCDFDCTDGSSSFVIRDSQNQIVKQESFDCRQTACGASACLRVGPILSK